jgi:purine-cytosine permease-like protein
MARVKLAGRTLHLPRSRLARLILGCLLIILGLFGFLPILGFWMVPVGLVVLSVDLHWVRRWRRRSEVAILRWWRARRRRDRD